MIDQLMTDMRYASEQLKKALTFSDALRADCIQRAKDAMDRVVARLEQAIADQRGDPFPLDGVPLTDLQAELIERQEQRWASH